MRACLQRSGLVTKRSEADLNSGRVTAFWVGRDDDAFVLIFKNARAARRFYYSYSPGPQRTAAVLLARNVEVLVLAPPKVARVGALERCVFGPHARPMASPNFPGRPAPTPADADISPGVRRLVRDLHVFRRAQNRQDVAGDHGLALGYVPAWTRLAAILPGGERVYFVVYAGVGPKGYGSQVIQWWLPAEDTAGFTGLPPLAPPSRCCEATRGRRAWIMESLVPNDVARVTWTWRKTSRRRALVLNISTPDNLQVAFVPLAYGPPLSSATYYSASGKVLASGSPAR
jgi:hypothetical protein